MSKPVRRDRKLDFDDMILYCYDLFDKRKDIRQRGRINFSISWSMSFRYNQLQYDIVKLLAKPQDNLFIVGDDDQSIYHFRGARPGDHAEFHKGLSRGRDGDTGCELPM